MKTRSSVATLPLAWGANGQPPRPPTEASKWVTPASSAASTLARAVLRVLCRWSHRTPARRLDRRRHQRAHLAGDADADRVGQLDLVRARVGEAPDVLDHDAGIDVALERAAEGHAQRHGRRSPAACVPAMIAPLRRRSPPRPSCSGSCG